MTETARYAEAEQVLREGIQGLVLEHLHFGYDDLGRLYKFQGRYDEAEKWYRKAIELKPEHGSSHTYLGVLLAEKGDFAGAEASFRKATRCSEERIYEAYSNLGSVLRARERYQEALGCYNSALESKRDYEQAKVGKTDMEKTIDFLMRQRELPEEANCRAGDASEAGEHAYALELCRELRRNFPDVPIWWLMEGVQLYETGQYEEAKRTLLEMIELFPRKLLHHAFSNLGHICRDQGRYDEAERWYRRAVQLKSEDAGWHVFLGALLARKGDLCGAEACHRKATQCAEGCVDEAYVNLGYVLRAQERYEEALQSFDKALEITPDYTEATVGKSDMEKVIEFLGANEPKARTSEKISDR